MMSTTGRTLLNLKGEDTHSGEEAVARLIKDCLRRA